MALSMKPVNPNFDGVDPTGADESEALKRHWGLVIWRAKSWLPRARRLSGVDVELEEVESYAATGLLRAIRAFDPTRGCRFSTVAVRYINTEIDRAINASARWGAKGELSMRKGYRSSLPRVTTLSAAARRAGRGGEDAADDNLDCLSVRDPEVSDVAGAVGGLLASLPTDEATVMRLRYTGLSRVKVAKLLRAPITRVIETEGRAVLRMTGEDPASLFVRPGTKHAAPLLRRLTEGK